MAMIRASGLCKRAKEMVRRGAVGTLAPRAGLVPRLASAAPLPRPTWGTQPRWASSLPDHKLSPMAPSYNPEEVERGWYSWWQEHKFFRRPKGTTTDSKVFSMVRVYELPASPALTRTAQQALPPPNVTGALHIGHATTVALEDALSRWRRMSGDDTMWVPGLDHAGIATQSVVEKQLQRTEGLSRHDLGREAFIGRVWEWYEQYGDRINDQQRRLGASLDWEQQVFTLDAPRSAAVTEAFVRLHEEGLIYRQQRMVNWCPHLRTAISDIEVDHKTMEDELWTPPGETEPVRFGVLHHFAYPTEDGRRLEVATTRLETMLGDAAVAVHPEDPRYADLIGSHVVHPINGQRLPIIGDAELVDMELGTGAVKITPAHDPNDLACARRHGLPEVNMMNEDGTLNETVGKYEGQTRFEARRKVQAELEAAGLYTGSEPHEMALGVCSRSGDVLEPMLMPQWFVRCDDMAAESAQMVRAGEMDILPSSHEATWFRWLDNIQDWCVSRQLWWGHRIPAYRVVWDGEELESADGLDSEWVVAGSEVDARAEAAKVVAARGLATLDEAAAAGDRLCVLQDEDVLDTWFSSALFPLTILGWPHDASAQGVNVDPELAPYYPLTVMETGSDILFFWVARMSMLCHRLSGVKPFQKILLHPLVRDKHGRKMSKSLGNVIDPLHMIDGISLDTMLADLRSGNLPTDEVERASTDLAAEFPKGITPCGCDALRFTLTAIQTGHKVHLDPQKVAANRIFCNKMWNAARYVLAHMEKHGSPDLPASVADVEEAGGAPLGVPERWILSRLAAAAERCDRGFETFHMGSVAASAHTFFLSELCYVYIEWSKLVLNNPDSSPEQVRAVLRVLAVAMDGGLRLFHPMMPFVTEELWQRLHHVSLSGEPRARVSAEMPSSITVAEYPSRDVVVGLRDEQAEADMSVLLEVARAGRSLRKTAADVLGKSRELDSIVVCVGDTSTAELLTTQLENIRMQTGAREISLSTEPPTGHALQLPGGADITGESQDKLRAEVKRLHNKAAKLQKTVNQLETRLADEAFLSKVPAHVLEKQQQQLATTVAEREAVLLSADNLESAVA